METDITISKRVQDSVPLAGMRLITLRTEVSDIVTVCGSFLGGSFFSPKENPFVANLTRKMLDQGTVKQSKEMIREKLAALGARIGTGSGTLRVYYTIKCLTQDVDAVVAVLAEELREPAFRAEDLATVIKQLVTGAQQSKDDPTDMAGTLLARALYTPDHPFYEYLPDEIIQYFETLTPAQLQKFHDTFYGLGTHTVSAVGDIDHETLSAIIKKHFGDWRTSPISITKTPLAEPVSPESIASTLQHFPIADKSSIAVSLGGTLGIDFVHDDFLPLSLGFAVLGQGFTSRLTQRIREEQGLTYSIGASIQGRLRHVDSHWVIDTSLPQEFLTRGIEEIKKVLGEWRKNGISETELAAKKQQWIGSFVVGLSTTDSIANTIIHTVENGRDISYIDTYPARIEKITVDMVNTAIKRYVLPEHMAVVTAGGESTETV